MLVRIPWSSRVFPEGPENLKSKPRGSYTTPKDQKAISLMETISFSSNKKFLPMNKMVPVRAKIATAHELLFEKEQTPALRVILRHFCESSRSRAPVGRPLGETRVDFEGARSQEKPPEVEICHFWNFQKKSIFSTKFSLFQMLVCIPWSSRIFWRV